MCSNRGLSGELTVSGMASFLRWCRREQWACRHIYTLVSREDECDPDMYEGCGADRRDASTD